MVAHRLALRPAVDEIEVFPSRKAAAHAFGVSIVTIGRWLANGRLDASDFSAERIGAGDLERWPIQRLPCDNPQCPACYPTHAERGQVQRFGLREFARLAAETETALAEMTRCGTH